MYGKALKQNKRNKLELGTIRAENKAHRFIYGPYQSSSPNLISRDQT
jgi:hypothetical protein